MSPWGENGRAGAGEVGRADLTRQQEASVSIQGAMAGRAMQGFQAELHHDQICCEQKFLNREGQGVWDRAGAPQQGQRGPGQCRLVHFTLEARENQPQPSAPTLTLGESVEI